MNSSTFHKDLEILINKHSLENESDTPDFILASYLMDCLKAFDLATQQRDQWRGFPKFLVDPMEK